MRDYAELVKSLRYYGAFEQHAKEAADAIEEQHKRADELGEELTSAMELVHKRNEKIEKLQSELVTTRNQLPRWISVEERLPDVAEKVLTYNGNFVSENWLCTVASKDGKINVWAYSEGFVTHWMPLPEAPKEVE